MATLITVALLLVPLFFAVGIIFISRYLLERRARLPVPREDITRPAGYGIQQQMFDNRYDIGASVSTLVLQLALPFAADGVIIRLGLGELVNDTTFWFVFPIYACAVVYSIIKIIKNFKVATKLNLGLDAEMITAHALSKFDIPKVTVHHDLQCGKFNIDHVVVSPYGVYVIETKGRRKPLKKKGDASTKQYKVEQKGDALHFPSYVDTSTIAQAKRQAKWLNDFIASSTGHTSTVIPIVVLPGWFVQVTQKNAMRVMPAKNLHKHLINTNDARIAPEQLTRINHQIEQITKIGQLD